MARILIADDSAFARLLLRNIFEASGHEVVGEAEDGEEAIRKFELLKPDIVTLDIIMPKMDGIEVVKKIMKMKPDATVIMCTAVGQKVKVLEAMKAGAKGYIVKPFKAEKVVEEVNKVLEG
ncbi:MAG: response regulator [Candidatus Methanospirareceae archaeon]